MRRALASVVVVLAVALPHATDAGKAKKPKKAEAFVLRARESHETRAGVTVSLDGSGDTWRLRATDGASTEEVSLSSAEPYAELAFDRLYQAVPADDGVKVTVKPLPAAMLDDDLVSETIQAEATKRRIGFAGVGFSPRGGVAKVILDPGVVAWVGRWSGAILSFVVDPYAIITPALPAKAKTGRLVQGQGEIAVGGVSAKITMTNHKHGQDTSVADFTLAVRKGKKTKTFTSGWVEEPMFEVVAHSKLIWVRNDELIVAPAKKLAKKAISDEKAMAVVQAEADRRGIPHDGAGAYGSNGVAYVELSSGGTTVVRAVVGKRSKLFLRYDVAAGGVVPEVQTPATREPEPIASTTGMQTILDEHNRYRAAHCAPALTWSDTLAAAAQKWAEQLRDASCGFEHSSTKYGENLAAGSTGYLPPEEVVGMWYREIEAYDFRNGGFSMDTGHFTQVVWKGTKQLGCGMVTDCDGMDIWVCNYDPPGNYEGKYDKNVLPTSCK